MKRFLLALTVCLLAAGCSLSGSDDCDGREGLFIQTDRDSYQVGEEATLTVENCMGKALYIEKAYTVPPDYHLEKKVAGEWRRADYREIPDFRMVEVKHGGTYEFVLPVEPENKSTDSFSGTYRFEIDLYDGQQVENKLPKEKRVSNAFEITE